ncbi:exonuclease domain-containing protein [Domibacillus indicus]|uniref:exonuclease domain-containing protein n=1 Tax=Domibacillus indicus TaxID=1437523 RepID=UPI00203B4CB2|nr:exonuclease domain-containing protein [Domibacillus indicus]MCM3788152.1 exonuclease domain-containing protein [Domibacillus indicus]
MNYIVLDIEWNASKWNPHHLEEIIEISALKVSPATLDVVDVFSSLVKPAERLTPFTKKLTGITERDVSSAPSFPHVLKKFKVFLGTEESCFVTWGKEDFRFLEKECKRYRLPSLNLSTYIDILPILQFGLYDTFNGNTPSLTKTMEVFQIEADGQAHNSLDDSMNTLKVFRYLHGKLDVHATYKSNKTPEERYLHEDTLKSSGKKQLMKCIFAYMKKHDVDDVAFDAFFTSPIWLERAAALDLNEHVTAVFKTDFDAQKQKASEKYVSHKALLLTKR